VEIRSGHGHPDSRLPAEHERATHPRGCLWSFHLAHIRHRYQRCRSFGVLKVAQHSDHCSITCTNPIEDYNQDIIVRIRARSKHPSMPKRGSNHCGKPRTTRFHSCAQLAPVTAWKTSACPYVVIEDSKVLRRCRDVSHVPSDLVQLPIALGFSGMRRLECVDLQPRSWVQSKVPALSCERRS
jgi:hypothetical protein